MSHPGGGRRSIAGPAPRDPAAAPSDYRTRPFRPARWLPGGHLQTLGARLLRASDTLPRPYRRERLETPDGDFLDLDFAGPADDRPLVVVLHGLEGCSSSGYVVRLCRELAVRGLRAATLNFRSRSGEPNRLPRSYHAGVTDDLAFVLRRLAARRPGRPLSAAGFSLGGNVLLNHLGERGERGGDGAAPRLAAAVAISVPFDLALSADRMERGLARLYSRYFLRSLRASARAKARRFPEAFDVERALAARTIREFDDAVTAPVHGFRDADDYYRRCSSGRRLASIRVPTLILHALDDPLIPRRSVPLEAIRRNPWLVNGVTLRGGHVGFVEGGGPWTARCWAEREAARFLARAVGSRPRGRDRPSSAEEERCR